MSAATIPVPLFGTVSQINASRDGSDTQTGTTGAATEVISVTDEALSSNATTEKEKGS
jgi:hypothetical protein